MTIWFDVEDLIQYFHFEARPTGVQRLSFETYRAIWAQAGASGEVRFCRRNAARPGFRSIHFPALEAGIMVAACAAPPPSTSATATYYGLSPTQPLPPTRLAQTARRLPPQYRRPVGAIARAGLQMFAGLRELANVSIAPLRNSAGHAGRIGGHQFDLDGPQVDFGPGDWFANLGASWHTHYEPEFLAGLHASGARFALLAYDMIPELFPEWCNETVVADFASWLRDVIPHADMMFAISKNTAADLVACQARIGNTIPAPMVIPVGSHPPAAIAPTPPMLTTPYVLMVGTIEARKNHAAMMRVWRRLLHSMPEGSVPDLVFAGKRGWLTEDLLQQLDNASWFNGKIRWIDSPSESDLANLYKNCQFTAYPALYEGWGLPVTESLAYGKPVAASSCSAIPEAGGDFCVYFDPDNINDAYDAIRGLIENPQHLAALQARIAVEFDPPTWNDVATALLGKFGIEDHGLWPQSAARQAAD